MKPLAHPLSIHRVTLRSPRAGTAQASLLMLALAGLAAPLGARAQSDASEPGSTGAKFTLGAGAVFLPRFEGSDEYKLRGLPLISYRNGRFFADAFRGIGYDVSPVQGLQFGPVVSYRFGRKESDADRLRGLGSVNNGADLGAFVRWDFRPFFLHATLKQGLGGDVTGAQMNLGAGYSMSLSPADRLVFDASVDWADREVMQAYFGVTGAQAARSGLAAYSADAGVRRYGIGALWTHSFTPQWSSSVGVAVYRLGDEAANSSITQDRNAAALSVGVAYRF